LKPRQRGIGFVIPARVVDANESFPVIPINAVAAPAVFKNERRSMLLKSIWLNDLV